jgi:hypothetical protein
LSNCSGEIISRQGNLLTKLLEVERVLVSRQATSLVPSKLLALFSPLLKLKQFPIQCDALRARKLRNSPINYQMVEDPQQKLALHSCGMLSANSQR